MDNQNRIALISIHPDLSSLARKVIRETGKSFDIYTAVLDKGVEIARRVEEENIGAIISRGATGALIRAAVAVPVILVEITPFDILEALHKAKQISCKIAFFDYLYRKDKYDIDKIKDILSLDELKVCFYESQNQLNGQIEEVAAEGFEVVVTSGICIIKQAEAKRMKGVLISSSREALQDALLRAEEVITIRKRDRQVTERLKTIINHSYGGIIAVDKGGCITHYNPTVEEALGVAAEEVLGKDIRDIRGDLPLQRLYAGGEPVLNDIQEIKDSKYTVSRVPLKIDSESFGIIITFQEISKIQRLEAKIRQKLYDRGLVARYSFSDIIGNSSTIEKSVGKAIKYSNNDATVLITGESGTGKELFAQSIHQKSKRAEGPFVAVNCAAIPENLLESELFGYEDGAFTGAKKGGNPGLFEIAHRGTLFLDEILEMPLSLQARLLRVLQEKVVRRIGGHGVVPVDVRIIAAANRDMRQAVRDGEFREDLFFRINVLNLTAPPLRERSEDIPGLIKHFLEQHGDVSEMPAVSKNHLERLTHYPWPGNVRELESFIEKYVLLTSGEPDSFSLTEELIDDLYVNVLEEEKALSKGKMNEITVPLGTLEEMEKNIINNLLEDDSLSKEQLSKMLGVSRTTLWKKLKEKG